MISASFAHVRLYFHFIMACEICLALTTLKVNAQIICNAIFLLVASFLTADMAREVYFPLRRF